MPNTSRPRVDGSLGKALSQRCSAQGRRPALQKAESARSGGDSGHLGPLLREGQATSPHRLLRQDLCSYLHRRFQARDNARPAAAEWGTRGPRVAVAWSSGRSPVSGRSSQAGC